jgi:hypothetical protein
MAVHSPAICPDAANRGGERAFPQRQVAIATKNRTGGEEKSDGNCGQATRHWPASADARDYRVGWERSSFIMNVMARQK